MCLVVIGGEIFSKMEMVSRSRDSSFLRNNESTKQHNCRFLLLKRNIQNMTAGLEQS